MACVPQDHAPCLSDCVERGVGRGMYGGRTGGKFNDRYTVVRAACRLSPHTEMGCVRDGVGSRGSEMVQ